MNIFKKAIVAVALFPLAGIAGTFTGNWYTDASGTIQFSDNSTLLTNSYSVEVGVFATVPNFANLSALPSFTSLSTGTWDANILGAGKGGASLPLFADSATGYAAGSAAGMQVYAWVFNSKTVAASSHWSIITNPSWLLPTIPDGAANADVQWTITDAGTSYMVGDLIGNSVVLESAIPEPATYAAILGLVTLGLVGYRRFRRS